MSVQFEVLPPTWTVLPLGEIFFTTSGGTPSRKNPDYYRGGSIPWVKSGELGKGIIYKTEEYITPHAVENSSAKIFPKGTLLIALYGATIGKLGFLGVDAATNQAICGIHDSPLMNLKFIYFYLLLNRNKLIEQGAGGAQPNISQSILKELPVVIPPLAEQERIVAKIEELFAQLDQGLEALRTAQQQLKVYRQAVLKYAFEGRLTDPDVKEGELPEGWEETPLAMIGSWTGGGTPSKSQTQYWNGGNIMWVTPKDMKSDLIINTEDKITEFAVDQSSAKIIRPNSILIVMRSGILRRTLPIAYSESRLTVNQDMLAFTPKGANHKYIYYALKSKAEEIRKNCSKDGTTVESIESAPLKQTVINLAPNNEQLTVVAQIESRLDVCSVIEEKIADSLLQVEALRQSILKSAFEGRLVPQDPNDEPAAVLLERIKAERHLQGNLKRRKNDEANLKMR